MKRTLLTILLIASCFSFKGSGQFKTKDTIPAIDSVEIKDVPQRLGKLIQEVNCTAVELSKARQDYFLEDRTE